MVAHPFRLGVADLIGRPGVKRRERFGATLDTLEVAASRVPASATVTIDATLEWVTDGILVTGTVSAPWEGECRRCLGPARGVARADVRELFERRPREGESYLLDHDVVDLEPLTRDALLLELPLAPLCDPGCLGLCPSCGVNRNESPCSCAEQGRDPRWAALDVLLPGGSKPDGPSREAGRSGE